ncbi:MAG: glycosyl hydrolase [Lachnospiraceae bacterium]|nr:glycosyl hydrolase [Lachnospiraceae bacterium]
MTLKEKVDLCQGRSLWVLPGTEDGGVLELFVSDGPHGLRKQTGRGDHLGLNESVPATCFPTACALAASFDPELIERIGEALGEECRKEEVSLLLGPGANLKRSPLCGRNFEYFSEDPLVSGKLAAAWIRGIQRKGVGASLKHFAANNQEYRRMLTDSLVDERALRELYLKSFEIAVKEGKPWTVMTAYGRLNGTYCSENAWLLEEVLRKEWGFEGLTITDWGAMNDPVAACKAGLDWEMPGFENEDRWRLAEAVCAGELSEDCLDRRVRRILSGIEKIKKGREIPFCCRMEEHLSLAREAAENSAVLLKNDGILPGNRGQKIAVIGAMAKIPRYQGAGSSRIDPVELDCAWEAFAEAGCDAVYAEGYSLEKADPEEEERRIQEALLAVEGKDIVYLFIGLPPAEEAEGFDRAHMRIPETHRALVERISQVNPNLVLVLSCGAPVEMPWEICARGILLMYLGGCQSGHAAVNLLLGETAPSGRLAETFPMELADCPAAEYFPGRKNRAFYRESLLVGYRYYATAEVPVRYPFGYGLTYTDFSYGTMRAEREEKGIRVCVPVKNVGRREGKETVQLYSSLPQSEIFRPKRELRAFQKVFLRPGEETCVEFFLSEKELAYYNRMDGEWQVEGGEYVFLAGASCEDIRSRGTCKLSAAPAVQTKLPASEEYRKPCYPFRVTESAFRALYGREIPEERESTEFHRNSTLEDMNRTRLGRTLAWIFWHVAEKKAKKDPVMADMTAAVMREMPFRSLVMGTGGVVSSRQIDGLIDILNGHLWKGMKTILKKRSRLVKRR